MVEIPHGTREAYLRGRVKVGENLTRDLFALCRANDECSRGYEGVGRYVFSRIGIN